MDRSEVLDNLIFNTAFNIDLWNIQLDYYNFSVKSVPSEGVLAQLELKCSSIGRIIHVFINAFSNLSNWRQLIFFDHGKNVGNDSYHDQR